MYRSWLIPFFCVIQKREGKGIWENLYEFTLVETQELIDENQFIDQLKTTHFFGQVATDVCVLSSEVLQHKLSHQHLYIRFYGLKFDHKIPEAKTREEIQKLPFPIVIHNFMQSACFNSL